MRKRLLAAILAAALTLSLSACGGSSADSSTTGEGASSAAAGGDEKIVIWTLAEDLKQFATRYTEQTGVETEVIVIQPGDYVQKLTAALGAKAKEPDVIVGEPQMLPNFFEAGFFADISEQTAPHADKIVDYVMEIGKDEAGVQRAVSYQITPYSIIYRRDLATKIWGDDSPEFVETKFTSFDTMLETAKEVKAAGYRIFNNTGDADRFNEGREPWVKDGKLQLGQHRLDYMDLAYQLWTGDLVSYAPEWSSAWFASMAGELPIDAGWDDVAEVSNDKGTTQVLAYTLPTWGALIIRDNAKENIGKFGLAHGPSSMYGGGTFLGINEYSEKKEAAWNFVEFVTLNEETSKWWLDVSNGDVVSLKSTLDANLDYENAAFANQKTYAFYLDEAAKIDYSTKTKYDDQIRGFFAQQVESYCKGEKSKEQALSDFYNEVKMIFPEIEVPA